MLIARGAEAILYTSDQKVLIKERIKKSYRIAELDLKLRRARTRTEARMIEAARRAGVPVPQIFKVSEYKIFMQYIRGERLKELLAKVSQTQIISLAREIGKYIAKLHSHGIVHGDLTTSNMILADRIYFIDFGLSYFSSRAEDFGEDLAVLHEAVRAAHFENLNIIWKNILISYKEFEGAQKALKALDAIERRGRYVRRT